MQDLLKATALTMAEVAFILGVTRITIYKWCKGTKPHPLLRERVNAFYAMIGEMQENEKLPLPTDIDKERRKEAINAMKLTVLSRSA